MKEVNELPSLRVGSEQILITHLKQQHMPPFFSPEEVDPFIVEMAAYSQHLIIKSILANPQAIVVNEGLDQNLTTDMYGVAKVKDYVIHFMDVFLLDRETYKGSYILVNGITLYYIRFDKNLIKVRIDDHSKFSREIDEIKNNNTINKIKLSEEQYNKLITKNGGHANLKAKISQAKKLFPLGISNLFSDLNNEQKFFLAKEGGPETLFYLKKLSQVYQSIDWTENSFTYRDLHDENLIFEKREKQAIYWTKQAVQASGKNEVLLVFGKNHDFEERIKPLKGSSVIFHQGIDCTPPPSLSIPPKLAEMIDGELYCYVLPKKLITIHQLIHLFLYTPWVIDTLRMEIVQDTILFKKVTVKQIIGLNAEQCKSILTSSNMTRQELKLKIEGYIIENGKNEVKKKNDSLDLLEEQPKTLLDPFPKITSSSEVILDLKRHNEFRWAELSGWQRGLIIGTGAGVLITIIFILWVLTWGAGGATIAALSGSILVGTTLLGAVLGKVFDVVKDSNHPSFEKQAPSGEFTLFMPPVHNIYSNAFTEKNLKERQLIQQGVAQLQNGIKAVRLAYPADEDLNLGLTYLHKQLIIWSEGLNSQNIKKMKDLKLNIQETLYQIAIETTEMDACYALAVVPLATLLGLEVPDQTVSKEQFLQKVKKAMGIKDIELIVSDSKNSDNLDKTYNSHKVSLFVR